MVEQFTQMETYIKVNYKWDNHLEKVIITLLNMIKLFNTMFMVEKYKQEKLLEEKQFKRALIKIMEI